MTPFGKAVRHLRIEHEMMLGEMADALEISPSYLSQIETGKKSIPVDLVDRIAILFGLSKSDTVALREEASKSMTDFRIRLSAAASTRDRLLANELAFEFARLTPEEKDRIQRIVRGGRNDE